MKRLFALFFSVILVAFLSTSFANSKLYIDKDVGYSITLSDQNVDITTVFLVQYSVVFCEVCILLDRGVSVPYKGLIYIATYNQFNSYVKNTIITKKYHDSENMYLFACDLSNRSNLRINII